MKAIQSVQYHNFNGVIEDQHADLSQEKELSEANHPLLIAYWQHLREIKNIHTQLDNLNKNASILHQVTRLCEHNLVFFLMLTGQFAALHDLFKPSTKSLRSKSLIHKIKKRRRHRRAAANQKEFSFVPKIIHSSTEFEKHIRSANARALKEWASKEVSELSQESQSAIQTNRYCFFNNSLHGLSTFSEISIPLIAANSPL
jgi:hypothetical protein